MDCAWKPNWEETKQHFIDWWNREGLVLGTYGITTTGSPHEPVEDPGPAGSVKASYTDAAWRARQNHYDRANKVFPADAIPIANTMIGPGSLALFVGSEPGFSERTVWFEPCIQNVADPEKLPPLRFDPENSWWKISEAVVRECQALAKGKYFVGCPDLIENIDILASLRDAQTLLMDMIERPDWVTQKMFEINQVWFEAYNRIYDIIKSEDGGATWAAFRIWAPGKMAKVQCDASAMFSPDMFKQFVIPALTEQCEWLDYSLFHLDGTQCIGHLDHLLDIESLDAVEWTPQAGIEGGGSSRWYDMYKKILAAGKSVQAIGVEANEVVPLLDAVGGKGMFVLTDLRNEERPEEVAEKLAEKVDAYR